jgi:pyruvate ferredoxin oxidoreductase gamma subunit
MIDRPDLVVVADESLMQVPAAGVLRGLSDSSTLVIVSAEAPDVWRERLGVSGMILTLHPGSGEDAALTGIASVGAAARLIGRISARSLEDAIRLELEGLAPSIVERSVDQARQSFSSLGARAGCVTEGKDSTRAAAVPPKWVKLEAEPTFLSAPNIHGSATSERVATGLWRTMRPVIDETLCNRCSWICSTLCPDGAIDVGPDRKPTIDYDHCKGCMVCAAVCPPHAIHVEPESAVGDLRRES